ncbi:MAG: discoidin domain-containing protein [Tannerella sp.]|nr:discoidin domain-containing protein [Tannerella sp.]
MQDKFPHQIVIDLDETKTITGFEYLPRLETKQVRHD